MEFCNLGGDRVHSLCRVGDCVAVYGRFYIQSMRLNYGHIQTLISIVGGKLSDMRRKRYPGGF